jgi:hypothetical protein
MTYMVKAYGKEMLFFDKFDILYINVQDNWNYALLVHLISRI